MGGNGSGWFRPSKGLVERTLALPVRELVRLGMIRPGRRSGTFTIITGEESEHPGLMMAWTLTGTETTARLTMAYTPPGCRDEITLPLQLVSAPLPWGARSWWWCCPQATGTGHCGRRAATLYLPWGKAFWGCRLCHRLAYTSTRQHGDDDERLLRFLVRTSPELLADLLGRTAATGPSRPLAKREVRSSVCFFSDRIVISG